MTLIDSAPSRWSSVMIRRTFGGVGTVAEPVRGCARARARATVAAAMQTAAIRWGRRDERAMRVESATRPNVGADRSLDQGPLVSTSHTWSRSNSRAGGPGSGSGSSRVRARNGAPLRPAASVPVPGYRRGVYRLIPWERADEHPPGGGDPRWGGGDRLPADARDPQAGDPGRFPRRHDPRGRGVRRRRDRLRG